MVDENSSQGNIPVTVNVSSNLYPDVEHGVDTIFKVLPDRLPEIIIPEFTPRCTPGDTCDFPVEIRNIGEATDVFTIGIEDKNMPSGLSFNKFSELSLQETTLTSQSKLEKYLKIFFFIP